MRTETEIEEQGKQQAQEVRLGKRRMNPAEAAYWSAPFSVVERKRGDTYWVAKTGDAQGDGPIFRVTGAKKNRDRVTPEMVVRAVEGEMVMGEGRVVVTEVVDGLPTFAAAYDVEHAWGGAQPLVRVHRPCPLRADADLAPRGRRPR